MYKQKVGSPLPENFTPKQKAQRKNSKSKNSVIPSYVLALSVAFNFTEEGNETKKKLTCPKSTKKT